MLIESSTRGFLASQAQEFLAGRVTEQAMLERAPLSDTEKSMLRFSPTSAQPDWAALDAFNERYNTEEYGEKIIGLVRRAYAFDRRHQRAPTWKEALHAARDQDFYLARIIQQKGLSPPVSERTSYKDFLWFVAAALVLAGSYAYAKAFQIHEDWELALFSGCVIAILAIMRLVPLWIAPDADPWPFSFLGRRGLRPPPSNRRSQGPDDRSG